MSDQERKGHSGERGEGGGESEETSTSKAAGAAEKDEDRSAKAGRDAAENDEEAADKDEASENDDDESEDEDEDEEGEGDAAAQRVAAALGVEEEPGEEGGEAKPEEQAAPANRSARRAEAAQRRKKRKTAATASARSGDDADDEPLPKDKNARAKELLKRRREQAAGPRPIQLLPGEMVDDALARSSSAASKWIRENFGVIQWVILGALVAGGGYLFYQSRVDNTAARASAELMAGVDADRARVLPEDKRSEEEKEADPLRVFKTAEERTDTALAAFKKAAADYPGTGAAILARLGEAGALLDKHDWDHALEAYSAVSSSSLANADPDVKGRALEGLGFAKEGKGDRDGALTTFKELENVDARGYKELALYHQGRLWLAKGDKDKAKDLLKQAHDKLEQPTTEGQPSRYLQQMTDELLRRIDPSLVPPKAPMLGGPKGGSMSKDEIEKLRRQLEEAMKKKGDQH